MEPLHVPLSVNLSPCLSVQISALPHNRLFIIANSVLEREITLGNLASGVTLFPPHPHKEAYFSGLEMLDKVTSDGS